MLKQTVVIATRSRSRDRITRFIHPKLAVVRNPPLVAVVTNVEPAEALPDEVVRVIALSGTRATWSS